MSYSNIHQQPQPPSSKAEASAIRFSGKKRDLEVDKLFRALVKLEGSDLHLKVGRPPYVRVKGSLQAAQSGADRRR